METAGTVVSKSAAMTESSGSMAPTPAEERKPAAASSRIGKAAGGVAFIGAIARWPRRVRKGKASLRRPKAWRPLETHSCWRLGRCLQLISTFLLAPQAIDITSPGNSVRSQGFLGFASARGEIVGLRSKAADPAASTNAIPKGASPLAAGGSAFRLAGNGC